MATEGGKVLAMEGDFVALGAKRDALEQERLRLQAEITAYPMPIPACDAQFNRLLEERSRVCEELARVQQSLRGG